MIKILKNSKLKAITSSQSGFTLMELIVSLAIISILISITLTNYKGGSKGTELIMASQKMVTDIRLAQNNSLGSVQYNTQIPQGGWGVYVDIGAGGSRTSYQVFADVNGNGEYDAGTEDNRAYGARTLSLPEGITIDIIDVDTDGASNNVHITFLPPDPTTIIFNKTTLNTSTEATIVLKEKWNNTTKDIYFNSFGLIEVIE